MLANTCLRLRSQIGRLMEAGVNLLGRAECRYTKEHVCKISGQYIHFNRSYDSFCNVRTFVLIYRPHPVPTPRDVKGEVIDQLAIHRVIS